MKSYIEQQEYDLWCLKCISDDILKSVSALETKNDFLCIINSNDAYKWQDAFSSLNFNG